MRAAVDFVFRNWPLKLAAILLATVLYAGIVVSQNARTWPGRVPIEVLNQPTTAYLIGDLPDVTNVRYFAPLDVANRIGSASFTATVDLGAVDAADGAPFASVPVVITATDPRVQIVDYEPQRVQVRLDPLVTATVPVEVDRGSIPDGLAASSPTITPETVSVAGPESQVRQVASAVARVRIQPAGLDIDQQVDLVPTDALGERVDQVELDPQTARIRIAVSSQATTRTLPVAPVIRGDPAEGTEVTSIEVSPVSVLVSGDSSALAGLGSIPTRGVSIAGAKADVTRSVALVPPEGVTIDGPTTVQVTVRIRETRETRDYAAGLILSGARDDLIYELSTDRVVVTLGGTTAALNSVDGRVFTATIDVSDLAPGAHLVTVRLVPPTGLSVVSIAPAQVTVTVSRPIVPTPTPAPPSPSALP
jgi:YbbR domain-containing protein